MNSNPSAVTPGLETRRDFMKKSALATAAVAAAPLLNLRAATAPAAAASSVQPWYRRSVRWMQTNIAELDITRYDIPWWREQWKRTHTQGIVVNAGGIVAYYPTQIPLHRRAEFLGDRDLFGDLLKAAHEDGIAVFARMDSNGASDEFYQAHPDWFTQNAAGRPYRDRDLNIPCINGPYYREHIPSILREIASKYHPDGFTDNIWSGLPRANICYCANCSRKFKADRGLDLPQQRNWNEPAYRAWIEWNYGVRLEIWDEYNRVTRTTGGPDCIWSGMMNGSIGGASADFRDYREIARRAEILMLDAQRRADNTGFQANSQTGKLAHGMLGWDKLMPESMALYHSAGVSFRLAAKPEPEVRLWAVEGFAGGIQPWWHYVNAYHEDRRMYPAPFMLADWQQKNEEYLLRRQPVATVGVVYSQRNNDFFGREEADLLVNLPQRGFTQALARARIPYVFVNADDLERDAAQLKTLILPNLGTMADAQVAAVRQFVNRGGGLVATGASSLCDQWGDPRANFALADVFGVSLGDNNPLRYEQGRRQLATENVHTYLRLTPELRAGKYGPHPAGEPAAAGTRHPALKGFDDTDLLAFGGSLGNLTLAPGVQVLLTFVPSRPAFPPEAVWATNTKTDIPGLVLTERANAGRVAYLAADLDRRYARDNLPDYGDLLTNLIRWTAKEDIPLSVSGPGFLDCQFYRQPGRVVLHLVNLTNEGAWRGPLDELIPVGPIKVRARLPEGVAGQNLRLLVSDKKPVLSTENGWAVFEIPSILDHEVAVIGT